MTKATTPPAATATPPTGEAAPPVEGAPAQPPEAKAPVTEAPPADGKGGEAGGDVSTGDATTEKPEGGTKGEGETKGEAAELELKFPESIAIDSEALAGFKGVFKEAGLKQEAAQKIADAYSASIEKAKAKYEAEVNAVHEKWQQAIAQDKDFGGERLEASKKAVGAALDKFGSPELVKVLNDSGLGNHPALFRFFATVAKADAEDTVALDSQGQGKPSAPEEHLRKLYPTMYK
jgi:hypothetical protein